MIVFVLKVTPTLKTELHCSRWKPGIKLAEDLELLLSLVLNLYVLYEVMMVKLRSSLAQC